jgi:cell division transport system permease protein
MSPSSDDPRRPPAGGTQRTPPARGPAVPAPPRLRETRPDSYETAPPDPYAASTFEFELGPPPAGIAAPADIDHAFREVMTGPPPGQSLRGVPVQPQPLPAPHLQSPMPDLHAPVTSRRETRRMARGAPIVPPGSVTGRSLMLVIVIMCFLACLTAGAVYMMNQSAAAWLRDIASEVTVQIEGRDRAEADRTVPAVARWLEQQKGIRSVKVLSAAENAKLTEAWLGEAANLKDLPVPRLIALEVDRNAPPDFAALRTALSAQFKTALLDDHRHWQQQIRTVTRSFALGGLAILMLVGAATTAVIVSATRSALSANREIVEVLHFVGATDRFIAREFEKHFLWLGVKAGLLGAMAAAAAFLALPFVMELLGGGTVTMAELRRLVGSASLDVAGYILLGVVVIVIAALCMLTSRIGVYRILNAQH